MVKKTVLFTESIQHLKIINDDFNNLLLSKLKEAEDKNYLNKASNVFGIQTKDVMCEEIFTFIKVLMDQCLTNLFKGHSTKFHITNFWINRNNKGSFNRTHIHPGGHLSAVYYVKAPKNCVDIIFSNPNIASVMQGFDKLGDPEFQSEVSVKPEAGTFILFPAYMPHEVQPNQSDEERISASFNVQVELVDG